MLKKHQGFNFAFGILFILQLLSQSDTLSQMFLLQNLHYFTKPLITLSLLGLLIFHTGLRGRFSKRIGIGLIFGLFGDVFLMFDEDPFFMCGLVSFLIGHLAYSSAFYLDYKVNKGVYKKHSKNAIIAYCFYIVIFCTALWNHLGEMKIPVIIYAIVISLMGIMAVNRFGRVNSLSFKAIFYGSLLFVLSDSILAINRFAYSFKLAGVLIMASYMAAQYLITMGNIERKMKKRIEEI